MKTLIIKGNLEEVRKIIERLSEKYDRVIDVLDDYGKEEVILC